jgi:hypothetical protein
VRATKRSGRRGSDARDAVGKPFGVSGRRKKLREPRSSREAKARLVMRTRPVVSGVGVPDRVTQFLAVFFIGDSKGGT